MGQKIKQINISISQAAECYKIGGAAKELALSAYTEDEINAYIKKEERIDYNAVLEKFKANYPIGTIVYDANDYYNAYIHIIISEPTIKVVSKNKCRYGIVTFQSHQLNPFSGVIIDSKVICSDEYGNTLFYDGVIAKLNDFSYEEYRKRLITKFSDEIDICKRKYEAEKQYMQSIEEQIKNYNESIDKFDERYNNFINIWKTNQDK